MVDDIELFYHVLNVEYDNYDEVVKSITRCIFKDFTYPVMEWENEGGSVITYK